jgi:hypothetical protein
VVTRTHDVLDKVVYLMDFSLKMDHARSLRADLVEERMALEIKHSNKVESVKFSLPQNWTDAKSACHVVT